MQPMVLEYASTFTPKIIQMQVNIPAPWVASGYWDRTYDRTWILNGRWLMDITNSWILTILDITLVGG